MTATPAARPHPVRHRQTPPTVSPTTGRYVALAGLIGIATAVVVLLIVGPPDVFGAGPVTEWGLPVVRVIHDLAAALTIGLLVLAVWMVAPEERGKRALAGLRGRMARWAGVTAAVWGLAGVAVLVLTTAQVAGVPVGTPGFGGVLVSFATQVDLGRQLGISVLLVAIAGNVAILAVRQTTLAWAAVISLIALLPLALAGHAAGSEDHMNAVDSLALHLAGVTLWAGGLAALLLVARGLGDRLTATAQRYSTLAGICFVVVAFSGVINAGLRLHGWAGLATPYGLLVVGKTVALLVLGAAGALHRRVTLVRLPGDRRAFVRLAAVEVLVMAATMGLAVALARSAPPEQESINDPVSGLLGYPAPPPVTVGRYFTAFYPETLWLTVALAMAILYAAGLVRLHRRGDRWPVGRAVFWFAGCLLLAFVTSGGPMVYGRLHFSTHMIQHMALMILVPMPLVFGAPVTLAMRTLPARPDGSFGPREVLLTMIHSRFLKVMGHPLVAEALFIGGLIVFYYSPLFQLAMFTHTGHVLMTAHFMLTGYLFVWSLVGIDPGPDRPPYPFRLLLMLVMLGFHAFFGISLMSSGSLIAADWWHAIGQTDDAALLADQQTGGAIAWGAGDLPSFLLALALIVGWYRSDRRESRQSDRRADRDGDADLQRYNEQLAAMSQRKARS